MELVVEMAVSVPEVSSCHCPSADPASASWEVELSWIAQIAHETEGLEAGV